MDGIYPGSLNTLIAETPVISLSVDGKSEKGRWNGIWFHGDGKNNTRIQGGVYENEYVLADAGWRISLLRYYAMYERTYEEGWKNVDGKSISYVPYHFTAESSGLPIPMPTGNTPVYNGTIEHLATRIQAMNDKDVVRNLMHSRGFYVDRRMWTDVEDLHTLNTTVRFANGTAYTGKAGARRFFGAYGARRLDSRY